MKRRVLFSVLALILIPVPAIADDPGASPAPSGPAAPTFAAVVPAKSPATHSSTSSTAGAPLKSSLEDARALLGNKNFAAAIAALKKMDKTFPNSADINNLLGFASRNLKNYADSAKYYVKALKLDPKHVGALEYQGELFLKTGKVALAKANLEVLKKLCGSTCEQYLDLKKAIGSK
jgi:tetratricopeptide (TPR) repeat protein